jgi:ElaB/YqjD/DUF883 family membrane-anchored ribosome-binding protein
MELNGSAADKRDNLVQDLKSVISDAEDLLKSTSQQVGQQASDKYISARERFETTLKNAKSGLSDLQDTVTARGREAVGTADQYVKENPWQSVGIGALAGLVVGFLLLRK